MNADNSLGFNQSSLILSLEKQTACKNSCINKFIKEDKHVEIAIKSKLSLKKDNEKILLNVKKSMTGYDYGKILQKIENEIKLINNNIDQMYVDKLNNKISEGMYERLFSKLKNEIKQKENENMEIKRQKEESKQDDNEKIKSVIQEFLSLNKPTPEIMKVIINKIEIHQDKKVDLYFNFKQLNTLYTNKDINFKNV